MVELSGELIDELMQPLNDYCDDREELTFGWTRTRIDVKIKWQWHSALWSVCGGDARR